MTHNAPTLSMVVPMLNEAEVIPAFIARLRETMEKLGETYEVLFVDDGSTDGTRDIVRSFAREDPRIKLIALSRNFGKEAALTAGLDHASGQAVIPLDADLQDPPELIEKFVEKWHEGYDVVYGVRASRDEDSWLKRNTAHAFYAIISRLAGIRISPDAGDFRLLDRKVVDAISGLRERNRFMKGLFAWVGFRRYAVPFDRSSRRAGNTKFSYWGLWNLALDGLTGFSTLPLRIAGYLGFLTSITSVAYGGYLVIRTLVLGADVPGYASLMVAVLFLGGLQLMVLGVIGEYLGRSFIETKHRPLYIVREKLGFEAQIADNAKRDSGSATESDPHDA